MLGKYPIMPDELIRIIASRFFDIQQTWPEAAENVVFQIRLPRVIAGGMIGAALADYASEFGFGAEQILDKKIRRGFAARLGALYRKHPRPRKVLSEEELEK